MIIAEEEGKSRFNSEYIGAYKNAKDMIRIINYISSDFGNTFKNDEELIGTSNR